MAISKKGSRCIVVEGHAFRWRVRRRATYCGANGWTNFMLAVELATGGATLLVDLAHPHPSNWMGQELRPVLPSDVAAHIRRALARGWQPQKRGKPFTMSLQATKQKHQPRSRALVLFCASSTCYLPATGSQLRVR